MSYGRTWSIRFVVERFFESYILNPCRQQVEVVVQISYWLTYHADLYSNDPPDLDSPKRSRYDEKAAGAKAIFRDLACRLRSTTLSIPCYGLCRELKLVSVERKVAVEASKELLALAKLMDVQGASVNHESADDVIAALGIDGTL